MDTVKDYREKNKYLKIYNELTYYEQDFLLISKSFSSILLKKYKLIFEAIALINEIKLEINYILNKNEKNEYRIDFDMYKNKKEYNNNIYYKTVLNESISIYEKREYLPINKLIESLKYNDLERRVEIHNNYLDLRRYYNSSEYFPSIKKITNVVEEYTNLNEEVIIVFPLYLDEEQGIFNSKKQGYFKIYYEFSDYYNKLICEIIKINKLNKITIILPNLMRYKDYISWEVVIKNIAKNNKKNIRVGLVLEDYEMYFDIGDKKLPEFVIIDYKEINHNSNEDKIINFKNFKGFFESKFRDIHAILKNAKIEHYILLESMNNEQIIEKMIIMGFKKYIYDSQNSLSLVNSINNHSSRRGIFKKNQTNIDIK